jgi:hypothetical protein
MPYPVKDHGLWEPYTPNPLPDWAQAVSGFAIAFSRRKSDGMDWYEYRNADGTFADNAVLATTYFYDSLDVEQVMAVSRDETRIAPANMRVIEINGVDPSITDPENLFSGQAYDPVAKTFGPMPPPKVFSVSDYQFAGQAAADGFITQSEAMDWVARGVIPPSLVADVQQNIADPDRQQRVLLFLAGTTAFPRYHELTPVLATAFGITTSADLDAFFTAASKR